jgi:hypothetical protein
MVFVPGVSSVAVGGARAIPQSRTMIGTPYGLGITSFHWDYFNGLAKTATTGTFVLLHKPSDYWGNNGFCIEKLYAYQTVGLNYYGGQWSFMFGGNRYLLSGFSDDQTNKFHAIAMSHNGTEYRSAWGGAGQSGFTVTAGTEWMNDVAWGGGYDIWSLNMSFTSGGAQGAGGTLVLAAYLPGVVLTDTELKALRDNPWDLFESNPNRTYFDIPAAAETTTAATPTCAPYIQIPSRRLQQPQGPLRANPYWVARGLYTLSLPTIGDIVQGTPQLPDPNTAISVNNTGLGIKMAASTNALPWVFPRRSVAARTDLFLMSGATGYTGSWVTSGGRDKWNGEWSNNNLEWMINGEDEWTYPTIWRNVLPFSLLGDKRLIAGAWNKNKNSGYGRVWVDGKEYDYIHDSYTVPLTANNNRRATNSGGNVGTNQPGNALSFFASFDSDLMPEEIVELTRNPWQLFDSKKQRSYFDFPTYPVSNTYGTPLVLSAGELQQATSIPLTKLGSGTPDATKILRGDGVWAPAIPTAEPDAVLELNNLGGL